MAVDSILKIERLTKKFGGLTALNNVSIDVKNGAIHSIIGPNGAGKTTFFNCISGIYEPSAGSVIFAEKNIGRLKPFKIARTGIARTFQNIRLFAEASALENVMTGHFCTLKGAFFRDLLLSSPEKAKRQAWEEVAEVLDFVGFKGNRKRWARTLPYGEQKRLEIARALATNPKLILLDEPAAGMNNTETLELVSLILRIKERGITVVLIEHDMRLVMNISETISVLDHGEKIAEGPPSEIRKDRGVIEAYLGKQVA